MTNLRQWFAVLFFLAIPVMASGSDPIPPGLQLPAQLDMLYTPGGWEAPQFTEGEAIFIPASPANGWNNFVHIRAVYTSESRRAALVRFGVVSVHAGAYGLPVYLGFETLTFPVDARGLFEVNIPLGRGKLVFPPNHLILYVWGVMDQWNEVYITRDTDAVRHLVRVITQGTCPAIEKEDF